jgi:hypothetical protein
MADDGKGGDLQAQLEEAGAPENFPLRWAKQYLE